MNALDWCLAALAVLGGGAAGWSLHEFRELRLDLDCQAGLHPCAPAEAEVPAPDWGTDVHVRVANALHVADALGQTDIANILRGAQP